MATEIHGTFDPRFAPLADALRANFDDGLEVGASLGVCLGGEPVVDLWAGHADHARTRPWNADTIVLVNSATKIPLLVMTLMLVDRGLIALDAPVADYWPAFAQGRKGGVTVRDVLTHQSGVPGLDPPPASMEAYRDWDGITARIAAEPHWFGGERRVAYQIVNSGFILGELMRRVDGRMARQFFDEEIGAVAGIDLQIGVRDPSQIPRLAATGFLTPPSPPPAPDPLALRMMMSLPMPGPISWEGMNAQFPSGNAFTNGRALARVGAILANDGLLDGRRFVSQAMVREAATEQAMGDCPMFGPMRMGLHVCLDHPGFPMPSPTSFYWGGSGGAFVIMDPSTGVSAAFAMNAFIAALPAEEETRRLRLWGALSDILATLPSRGATA